MPGGTAHCAGGAQALGACQHGGSSRAAWPKTLHPHHGAHGVGLAAQSNAYDRLKSILLDAHRLGLCDDNPLLGVKPPQYDPKRAVIPSPAQLQALGGAEDDVFRLVVELMSGCGKRNGEAAAVNVNNIVDDDVYRVTEQVNQTTKRYDRLRRHLIW
ncbi:hypothetical protein [Streptomyces sp. INR7]|uniref:hypothetical protein n=1 Tax=Streptomyces sp. INR7 TaxID=2607753 RepID=UPI0021563D3F|nr:hypothetical protein [Streptomyces sp. INR7]